jgi:hypothetical protein
MARILKLFILAIGSLSFAACGDDSHETAKQLKKETRKATKTAPMTGTCVAT